MELLGEAAGRIIVDDYAHHPTAIAAVLATLRQQYPARRLVVCFQPHQALRVRRLLDEMADSLQNADCVVLTEIVRAREGPWRSGDTRSEDLAAAVARHGAAVCVVARSNLVHHVQQASRPGDVVALLGAGDIGKAAHELADWL